MFAGADETIINDRGETPAQLAEKEGHIKLLTLLNRGSLWQEMPWRGAKLKLSVVVLMILTLRLMTQKFKILTRKWRNIIAVAHVLSIVRRTINSNRRTHCTLKRKADSKLIA